jgi:hypothetical protein
MSWKSHRLCLSSGGSLTYQLLWRDTNNVRFSAVEAVVRFDYDLS